MDRSHLARAIRKRRRQIGLTQADFAGKLGLSQQWVSRLEEGASGYSFRTLQKLADALGLDVEVRLNPRHPKRPAAGTRPAVDPNERAEILSNIRWFSRLDPRQKIRAAESHRDIVRRMRDAQGELHRPG